MGRADDDELDVPADGFVVRDPATSEARSRVPDFQREYEEIRQFIAATIASSERLSYNRNEAAAVLGVSPEFFIQFVEPEIRFIKRGRRRIYPLSELLWWLWESAEGCPEGRWPDVE